MYAWGVRAHQLELYWSTNAAEDVEKEEEKINQIDDKDWND